MNTPAVTAFEESLSNELSGQSFIKAGYSELAFVGFAYLGNVARHIRSFEALSNESTSPALSASIDSLKSMVREISPRAAQLVLKVEERNSKDLFLYESSGDDDGKTCGERIQEHNREGREKLREAKSIGETWDAIKDWGGKVTDDLGKCYDRAMGKN